VNLPLKVYTYGAVVLALFGVVYWALWTAGDRDRANRRADAYEAQSDLNAGATEAVERVLRTETVVNLRAQEASDAIVTAPGADAPIPDDVLSAWRAGIDGVREAGSRRDDSGP